MLKKLDKMFFSDNLQINDKKHLISVRDGVQEYLGIELGLQPYDKVFKVYRSPDTIKAIQDKLNNIPLTDEHVDLKDIPKNKIVGKVEDSKVVDFRDDKLSSTVAIENVVKFDDNMLQLLNVKNQLSLGYFADIKEHNTYDFEQYGIIPHHLAVVSRGRCGDVCKFKDGVSSMAEETKKPDDDVKDEKGQGGEDKKPNFLKPDDKKSEDKKEEKVKDEDKKSDDKKEVKDSISADKIIADFKDSQDFKDAVMQMGNQRAEIILKAKNFLDDGYKFEDKDNLSIMKDVLDKELKEKFEDSEVGVAFKMLKKMKDYSQFADSEAGSEWHKIADKEL